MAKYKLGEICEIVSGSTPKTGIAEYWDGNLKWITPAEIDDESYIITDSARKLTELGVKKTGLSSFPSGTVILSSRAPIGKVAIAGCEMYCNQGFKNLICSDRINNRYLYWFLKGNTAYLNSLGRGATFKEISKKIVSDIEINVPEISQQLAAVDALERVSEIIRLRKNQLQKLDELIKARFVELFGDPMTDVSKWSASTIGEQFNVASGGTPATGEKAYWENGTIPWIGSNMCQDTMLSENDGKFITEEGYAHKDESGAGFDIVKNFSTVGELAGCEEVLNVNKYFDNLIRLGLLKSGENIASLIDKSLYEPLKTHNYIVEKSKAASAQNGKYNQADIKESYMELTDYGELFCTMCIGQTNK